MINFEALLRHWYLINIFNDAVPNLQRFQVADDPVSVCKGMILFRIYLWRFGVQGFGICVLPAARFPGNWSRNVRGYCSASLLLLLIAMFHSENPFNYDLNDLGKWNTIDSTVEYQLTGMLTDLDHFCLAIQRELHEVTAVSPNFILLSKVPKSASNTHLFSTPHPIPMVSSSQTGTNLSRPRIVVAPRKW
jgi:hypothetical protein